MNVDPSQLPPREIFERVLPDLAKSRPDIAGAVNAVLAIDLDGEEGGAWSLDLTGPPEVCRGVRDDADCVVKMKADHFRRLLRTKKISPWLAAYTTRKIKVEGDMPTIIKLGQMLNTAVGNEP